MQKDWLYQCRILFTSVSKPLVIKHGISQSYCNVLRDSHAYSLQKWHTLMLWRHGTKVSHFLNGQGWLTLCLVSSGTEQNCGVGQHLKHCLIEVSGWSGPLLDDSLKTDGGLGPAFCLSSRELQLRPFYNKGASGNLAEEIAIDLCSLSKPG